MSRVENGSFVADVPQRSSIVTSVDMSVLVDEANSERACDTLLMCIVTVLNHGLRNGGGVGDVLRKPSKNVSTALKNTYFYYLKKDFCLQSCALRDRSAL